MEEVRETKTHPPSDGKIKPWTRKRILRLLVLPVVLAALWLYYGQLSIAARSAAALPADAAQDDVGILVPGYQSGQSSTVGSYADGRGGGVLYVTYSCPDLSRLTCVFIGVAEDRTRSVMKLETFQNTRIVRREMGVDVWGWPVWQDVSEPFMDTRLVMVDEAYKERVWKLRSTAPGFDFARIGKSVGL